jgi:hypothetical protein
MIEIIDRIFLGAKEYIKKDAKGSAIYALLTGESPDVESDLKQLDVTTVEALWYIISTLKKENISGLPAATRLRIEQLSKLVSYPYDRFLVAFCGPNSVGKDMVFSIVARELYAKTGYGYKNWRKYSTRKPQNISNLIESGDGKYDTAMRCKYLSSSSFHGNKDVVLSYKIYDCNHGFSHEDMAEDSADEKILACRYGKFEQIAKFRAFIEGNYKRRVLAILLTANEYDLRNRLELRSSLSPEERANRGRVLSDQIKYISNHNSELLNSFDLLVPNGNDTKLNDTVAKIVDFIQEYIGETDRIN